ncbi:hypothetical protein CYMTET_16915 [Cymbomonas tetramitiformis]|uniref:FAD dependent oxidoreductase domain-containing protein n=1 Tax=Cymbomonas tetramitiformis TaxID=36881 RepID=A0AAE0GBG9_9CHLO|nr:hypothetical protein CYMTET_16915 [Cymbomonas tetramitiformis]
MGPEAKTISPAAKTPADTLKEIADDFLEHHAPAMKASTYRRSNTYFEVDAGDSVETTLRRSQLSDPRAKVKGAKHDAHHLESLMREASTEAKRVIGEYKQHASADLNIAIIGGGMYGCHLAMCLADVGAKVTLYEKQHELFAGKSGYVSNRIHSGYHFVRSSRTRAGCCPEQQLFIKNYSGFYRSAKDRESNTVLVVAEDEQSKMDIGAIAGIFKADNLPVERIPLPYLHDRGFRNIQGGFRIRDPIMYIDYPREYFMTELPKKGVLLRLGQSVTNLLHHSEKVAELGDGCPYNFVLNTTVNQVFPFNVEGRSGTRYEIFRTIIVAEKDTATSDVVPAVEAFEILDGPFPGLEPYEFKNPEVTKYSSLGRLYQVTNAKSAMIGCYTSFDEACSALALYDDTTAGMSDRSVTEQTDAIIKEIEYFHTNFRQEFEVVDTWTSLNVNITDESDACPVVVCRDFNYHPRLFQIFSPKVSSIFLAQLVLMRQMNEVIADELSSSAVGSDQPMAALDEIQGPADEPHAAVAATEQAVEHGLSEAANGKEGKDGPADN